MYDHLKRFTYSEIAVSAEKRMTALIPAFFRSSCSGSDAQLRNVTTSLAICVVVAGVPICTEMQKQIVVAPHTALGTELPRTVFILDKSVKQNTRHGDSTAREEGVVVHALTDLNSSRRIDVTGQK